MTLNNKRPHVTSTSNSNKRRRAAGIGAKTEADGTARMIAAQHLQEHQGQGHSYLSTRQDPTLSGHIRPLVEVALRVSAKGMLDKVRMPSKPTAPAGTSSSLVGWDQNRDQESWQEMNDLADYVKDLPSSLANRLLGVVLALSLQEQDSISAQDNSISVLAVARIFFHQATTKISLANLNAPVVLLSKLPNCKGLVDLDLSGNPALTDGTLARIVAQLPSLETICLRGCTKVSDASITALSKATEDRLLSVNLSLCAVTVKGLISLLARCKSIRVLKLANVQGLNEKAINRLIDESTQAATGWRHVPLSQLQTLKLRSTDITDSSLGRILGLCALTLTKLDISYTNVKTLDIVTRALQPVSEWQLSKLVASGLALPPASMQHFFESIADRPEQGRVRFRTIKLGSLPVLGPKSPGLSDDVLAKLMPSLLKLNGLESVSFFGNWGLGKRVEPMRTFIERIGRRCKMLDLTLTLQDAHLEGLIPYSPEEMSGEEVLSEEVLQSISTPPKLEILVLDSSKITDSSADLISTCVNLKSLHLAETRITPAFLIKVVKSCPKLSTLNLTSCRGIPVAQRRRFFEAWKKREVEVDE